MKRKLNYLIFDACAFIFAFAAVAVPLVLMWRMIP